MLSILNRTRQYLHREIETTFGSWLRPRSRYFESGRFSYALRQCLTFLISHSVQLADRTASAQDHAKFGIRMCCQRASSIRILSSMVSPIVICLTYHNGCGVGRGARGSAQCQYQDHCFELRFLNLPIGNNYLRLDWPTGKNRRSNYATAPRRHLLAFTKPAIG